MQNKAERQDQKIYSLQVIEERKQTGGPETSHLILNLIFFKKVITILYIHICVNKEKKQILKCKVTQRKHFYVSNSSEAVTTRQKISLLCSILMVMCEDRIVRAQPIKENLKDVALRFQGTSGMVVVIQIYNKTFILSDRYSMLN